MMNPRKVLHDLVDNLAESELVTAARIRQALETQTDPFAALLASAPEDDEPFDERELEDTGPPYERFNASPMEILTRQRCT